MNGWAAAFRPLIANGANRSFVPMNHARSIPMPFHALGGGKDKIRERFTAVGQPSRAMATTLGG